MVEERGFEVWKLSEKTYNWNRGLHFHVPGCNFCVGFLIGIVQYILFVHQQQPCIVYFLSCFNV